MNPAIPSVFVLAFAVVAFAAPAVPAAAQERLVARGQEPSWRLDAGDDGVVLQAPPLGLSFRAKSFERRMDSGRPRLVASDGARELSVLIDERPCADTMTGMPFPVGVTVEIAGRRLTGCGGETIDMIEGGWRVIRLGDGPVPDGVVVTLEFSRDGRIAGSSGCNRMIGSYTLTGEGLSFGQLGSTQMACPPPAMEVEAKVHGLLPTVTRVTTGEGRQLRLMAGDTQALVLERAR